MKSFTVAILVAAICAPEPCWSSPPYRFKVDPVIRVWLDSPALRGQLEPTAAAPTWAPVLVRFWRAPGAAQLTRLAAGGVKFLRGRGKERYLHLSLFYPARVSARGVAALGSCPLVRQVDLDVLLYRARPLDVTAAEVGATRVWPAQVKGVPLTGEGMVIGNIDGGIDVFHPAFFKADGGLHTWLDVNKNGSFDPGTDAVDLNNNGKADTGELLDFFDAVNWGRNGLPMLGSVNGVYEPATDWLFADTNGNKKRDYGAAFGDITPTYGELLLVADDLNGNGKLDLEEKVVALKTSKIKATSFDGVERLRGKDLTLTHKGHSVSHGIATSGVLVGGQRGHHRLVGLAPDAELMMGISGTTLSPALIWLHQAGVHVILHEYAPWTGYHLDGSSNHEQLLDQAAKLGVPQVTPAGNLGGAHKHMRVTIKGGSTVQVPLNVPASTSSRVYYFMALTLLWRDPKADLEFSLTDSTARTNKLAYANITSQPWGDGQTVYYSYRKDSPRGTAMMDLYLLAGSHSSPGKLPSGSWTLTVKNPKTSGQVELLGYVYDPTSRWSKGIAFSTTQVSEKGIICWPATADSAITLGAYAGHVGAPFEHPVTGDKAGDLRRYSGRGVRIDGKQIMDITAPDNPLAPYDKALGAFRVFGGTSGAGPHVAAAAALIKQANPALDGLEVRAAIRKGALVDAQVGTAPSDTWGYGKLRIYRSIFGKDPTANTAPTIKVEVSGAVEVGSPVTLSPQAKDAEDEVAKLRLRWDDDYDGTWDTASGPVKARSVTFQKTGVARFKVRVEDTGGLTAQAAVLLKVMPAGGKLDQGGVGVEAGPADARAGDAGDSSGPGEENGCGCSTAAHSGQRWSLALPLVLLVLGRARRSRAS